MGNNLIPEGDFWAIDSDMKVLGSCEAQHTIHISADDDASIPVNELHRLAGDTANMGAIKTPGAPMPAAATAGVIFLLAGAGAVPGGSTMLLQLAAFIRRAGYFVVAALTRPFDFEGRRRLEEADALIEALSDVAQLTVVVAQGVLQRASSELTIKDASAISDNTLEYSVRSVLWALGAPELLRASQGAMAWHGRDLRQYKRLLSPPLERLLTCPGTAALGRGLASIPISSLREAGLPSTLSTLAEDAVTAASDSPFLDVAMGAAAGVMVVLSLPPHVLEHGLDGAAAAPEDSDKYAVRAAVQVAATTVLELAGANCHDVVVCAHIRTRDWPHHDPDTLCLEATMLVLEDPVAQEAAAAAAAAEMSGFPYITPRRQPGGGVRGGGGGGAQQSSAAPLLHSGQISSGGGSQQQQPAGAAPAPQRAWSAMSAIAGGSAAAAHTLRPAAGSSGARAGGGSAGQGDAARAGSGSSAPTSTSSSGGAGGGAGMNRGGSTSTSGQAPAARTPPRATSPLMGKAGGVAPGVRPSSPTIQGASSGNSGASGAQQPKQQQQQQQRPRSSTALPVPQLIPRMADRLVDSLVAQSLDLPPNAARWRHQQRARQITPSRRGGHFQLGALVGSGAAGSADGEDGAGAGADANLNLRSRVAGMLEQERDDAFDPFGSADE